MPLRVREEIQAVLRQTHPALMRIAIPFDLPAIKLLCLHVSEHRDESVVRPIWNQILDESKYSRSRFQYLPADFFISLPTVMQETDDPIERADAIMGRVVPLGQRFYPSESAFPLRTLNFH